MPQSLSRLQLACFPALAALTLAGCADGSGAGWAVVDPSTEEGLRNVLFLLGGLKLTLWLSVIALLAGVVLGLVCAALLRSHKRPLRLAVRLYVELIRTVPLFVLLLWVYYAVPIMIRSLPESDWTSALMALADLSPFAAATVALSANAGAFLTEIFRAGIESIPRGQVEAARSLGMSERAAFRRIVLPQALRRMLPPTVNQFIMTVKDSSLAAAIGLAELTRRATELQTQTYRPLELYSFLALEYLVVLIVLSRLARFIERRVVSE
jgi:His/Glu/Gln/Arg/opine family amino acid ABC transporter permease subunit